MKKFVVKWGKKIPYLKNKIVVAEDLAQVCRVRHERELQGRACENLDRTSINKAIPSRYVQPH